MYGTHIVRRHQRLLEPLIRLSDANAIISVKRTQGFDLVVQVFCQGLCEAFNEVLKLLSVIFDGLTCAAILFKLLEAGCESAVLLDILRHETFDAGDGFDAWEELFLFCIVVVVH